MTTRTRDRLPGARSGSLRRQGEREAEVRAASHLFVVGSPRSGTTWVQLLLHSHPDVATAAETQIFAYYLDRFRRQWEHEHGGSDALGQGRAGLSRLLDEEDFRELCRTTAAWVLRRIHDRNPEARLVVEKSPRHALQLEWIAELFPKARFLHVIRDPRDTAASLLAAGRSWAQWAPRNPIEAGRMWVSHVEAAMKGRNLGSRYREVRFEALKEDTVAETGRIYEWLGLGSEPGLCREAVEACRLTRLRSQTGGDEMPIPGERNPDGFFRKGRVGGWKRDLSTVELRLVEHVCADLMGQLGYRMVTRPGSLPARLRVGVHDGVQRIREGVDWQLERLLRSV